MSLQTDELSEIFRHQLSSLTQDGAVARPEANQRFAVLTRAHRLFWAAAITVTSWTTRGTHKTNDVDDSWRYSLDLARQLRIPFDEIAFTYGPLAALDGGPSFSVGALALSVVAHFAVSLGLSYFLIGILRTWMPMVVAVVLTWVLASSVYPVERVSEIIGSLAIAVVADRLLRGRSTARLWPPLAIGAGIWLAVKPSVAAMLAITAAVAAVAPQLDGRLRPAIVAIGKAALLCVATIGVTWIVAGQPITAVIGFVTGFIEVNSGFSQAMSDTPRSRAGNILHLIYLLAFVGAALALWAFSRHLNQKTRVLTLAFLTIAGFWIRQITLTRADVVHLRSGVTALALLGLVALRASYLPQYEARKGSVLLPALPILAVAALFLDGVFLSPSGLHQPLLTAFPPIVTNLSDFAADAESLTTPGYVEDRRETPPSLALVDNETIDRIASLGPGSVHVSNPFTLAYFYQPELEHWTLPTVQPYVSYTSDLEDRNIEALTGPAGPSYVIHGQVIDTQWNLNRAWASPGIVSSLWCGFDFDAKHGAHALLVRRSEPCAQSVVASTSVASDGSISWPTTLPPCPGAQTIRFHGLEPSLPDKLSSMFLRPSRPTLTTGTHRWDIVPARANQPHLLDVPNADVDWLELGGALHDVQDGYRIEGLDNPEDVSVELACWTK